MSNTTEAKEQAKRMIRAILQLAGGSVAGRVRLYKAFYAAHLFYWQRHEGTLSDYPIVRMPYGPGIDRGNELLAELQNEGRITIRTRMSGPYQEDVFRLSRSSGKEMLSTAEREAIERALRWVGKKSASVLSSETHLSRSWNAVAQGQEMAIYLDVLTEDEYQRIQESVSKADDRLSKVFGNRS